MSTTHTRTALVAALMSVGFAVTSSSALAAGQPGASTTSATSSSTASSTVASADRQFAAKAAQGGLAEVEMGKLAQANAQNDRVKSFGERMVKDHSAANDKLTAALSSARTRTA